MENVYYLVHVSDHYSPNWKELIPSPMNEYQFPGVYFTLITKENILTENLFPGKYIFLFSRKLLEQHNYHINIRDYNGFISEENTYFYWQLQQAVEKIKSETKFENEVVFHDPVSMDYLCDVIKPGKKIKKLNLLLPKIPLENDVLPDMSKEPFYCFPMERNYTGYEPMKESSRGFFEKMANYCGVDKNLQTDEIIHEIKEKMPELYKNRNLHIDFLRN
jgi:hypothetical protein